MNQIEMWKKYLVHIEEENKKIDELNYQMVNDWKEQKDINMKIYEAKVLANDKYDVEYLEKVLEWEKLSFWKKLTTERPIRHYHHRPLIPFMTFPFLCPQIEPKYEDFLTWCTTQETEVNE